MPKGIRLAPMRRWSTISDAEADRGHEHDRARRNERGTAAPQRRDAVLELRPARGAHGARREQGHADADAICSRRYVKASCEVRRERPVLADLRGTWRPARRRRSSMSPAAAFAQRHARVLRREVGLEGPETRRLPGEAGRVVERRERDRSRAPTHAPPLPCLLGGRCPGTPSTEVARAPWPGIPHATTAAGDGRRTRGRRSRIERPREQPGERAAQQALPSGARSGVALRGCRPGACCAGTSRTSRRGRLAPGRGAAFPFIT